MAGVVRRPYRDAFGHGMRPYLTVQLLGLGGRHATAVGLADSGADVTCLPMIVAMLLGYGREHLERVEVRQLGGDKAAWRATTPLRAQVEGLRAHELELMPVFVEGSWRTLWGRDDFFRAFDEVCFHEQDWALTLTAP
jgi:hypothetical protein